MAASDSRGTIKAQSAMEYLITYGWAILLIAVALAVLFYFNLINPSFFVGQQCLLPAGFTCTITGMSTSGLMRVNLYQSLGPSINITAIGCSSAPSFANLPAYTANPIVMRSVSNRTFQVQCYSGSSALSSSIGSAYMGYLLINYTQPYVSGFQHTASGKILAKTATATYICLSGGGLTCTQTTYGVNTIDTFTYSSSPGSTTWTVPAGVTSVQVLIVAGGGGGGGNYGGGGGAGGLIYISSYAVSGGQQISVAVGAGGASMGAAGGNSVFGSNTAIGGGAGTQTSGGSGGSGGGAGACSGTVGAGTTGQGKAGGAGDCTDVDGGGGGGACAVGGAGSSSGGGSGGAGCSYSISGASVSYAGGGGAASYGATSGSGGSGGGGAGGYSTATSGTNGLGGGGGSTGSNSAGSLGGSGILIISYATP